MHRSKSYALFLMTISLIGLMGCGGSGGAGGMPNTIATHFLVKAPDSATSGTPVNFTVMALDGSGNTVATYSGTVHFTSTDSQAALPANSMLTNGSGTVSATLKTPGSQTISATDTVTGSIAGTSNPINVSGAAATHFVVTTFPTARAGTAFSFTVSALDAANNMVPTYSGTAHFTSSDTKAMLPANSTLTNGTGTLSATLNTVGGQTITATDTVTTSITGTSNSINVSALQAATHFAVNAPNGSATGTAFNFTVTALDAANNVVSTYSGIVHFTTTDGHAALPPNSALMNGAGTFSATLKSIGNQTITATDTVTTSITGTSNSINVAVPGTLAITSGDPPAGVVGEGYDGSRKVCRGGQCVFIHGFVLSASGGVPPYSWSWTPAAGSSLPPGVVFSSSGLIGGLPTTAGTYNVIVTGTDSGSPAAHANASYAIVINPPSAPARDTTPSSGREHSRYKLVDLGTLGGPNSYPPLAFFGSIDFSGASLSEAGTLAGFADTSTPDPYAPNCFWDCFVTRAFKSNDGVRTGLGALPGPSGSSSAAAWISRGGLIVGLSENGEIDPFIDAPAVHAVRWGHDGQIVDLGTLKGGFESAANGVNDSGDVVGYASNDIADSNSLFGTATQTRAILWRNGAMQDLGTLGGTDALALFVNEFGQIAGSSYTDHSVPPQPNGACGDAPLTQHGFFWASQKMVDIGTLGGSCSMPFALNNRGQIAGYSSVADDQFAHAFLWERGTMTDLGTLGGTHAYAAWLNDAGEVVGGATNKNDQKLLAFLWKDGVITNLGDLPSYPCSAADAINSKGQIVGGSGFFDEAFFPACTGVTPEHAVLWEKGQIFDLNTLVDPGAGLILTEATFINDSGEISGYGSIPNGDTRAFLLIPCDSDHADPEGCNEGLTDSVTIAPASARPGPLAANGNSQMSAETVNRQRGRLVRRYRGIDMTKLSAK